MNDRSYVLRVEPDERSPQLRYYHRRKQKLAAAGFVQVETKRCPRCEEVKGREDFGVHTAKSDGLQSWCKPCVKEYRLARKDAQNIRSRRFRERHPKRAMAYIREARDEALRRYSLTDPPSCACCGEAEPAFLVLDHVHGGGTAHRREHSGRIWTWLRKNDYPEGYQVLCWNCNAAKAYQGICPHQVGKQVPLCVS